MTQTDNELIASLSQTGYDLPLDVAEEIIFRGERMVEPLCKVLLEEDFDPLDPNHALVLLGCIGSPKAASSILEWFRREPETDDLTEYAAVVLGRLGPEAIDPIWEYVYDSKYNSLYRSLGAQGLMIIAYHNPNERPRIAKEVVRFLNSLDIESDPQGASHFLTEFAAIDDEEVVQVIGEIFDRHEFHPRDIARDCVESFRKDHPPWWTYGVEDDLMALFTDSPLPLIDFEEFAAGMAKAAGLTITNSKTSFAKKSKYNRQ